MYRNMRGNIKTDRRTKFPFRRNSLTVSVYPDNIKILTLKRVFGTYNKRTVYFGRYIPQSNERSLNGGNQNIKVYLQNIKHNPKYKSYV